MKTAGTGLLLALSCVLFFPRTAQAHPSSAAAHGHKVYIQEGCIHCHSQYIRPGTKDIERWGPARTVSEMQRGRPPLIGNRRQGPDLLNIGNRRSLEWQQLHLKKPAQVSPGSTMPSYAHLFEMQRGVDLLAYLSTLGEETFSERYSFIQRWKANSHSIPISPAQAAKLYAIGCSQCHGRSGRGDGPLTARLAVPSRNLLSEPFRYIPENNPSALSRIIKFGILGTSMPGHEYLTDAQVLGLTDFVGKMRKDKK